MLVVGTGALSWRDMGFGRPLAGVLADLGTGAALAVPVLIVSLVLTALLAAILASPTNPLPTATTGTALVLNLVSAAVLAPLGEEVFFRGYTTTAWARAVGARSAILRGALFFSFAHITTLFSTDFGTGAPTALAEFLGLLPAGIALGWVFLARRSVWASIGLHATFNGLQLLLLFAVTTHG
jgi:membrane protease YdiL (CAAX protease family)